MDSVLDYSDDELRRSKESDLFESDSSSKEVFKSIRTRYLSRVHSVTDPPLCNNIVDQAFFKLNSPPIKDNDDNVEVFKFEIRNVTTDETADDASQKALSPNCDSKVLAEAVLPPFDNKVLTRQDATDVERNKITRQDAFDHVRHDSPELTDDLIDLSTKMVSKSESAYIPRPRDKTIFSRDFSGIYKGKPKAFSMENLNSSTEFKDALKEASSIDIFNVDNEGSQASLFTEGSDSVFMSPVERNNNDVNAISKYNSVDSVIPKKDTKLVKEPISKPNSDRAPKSAKTSTSKIDYTQLPETDKALDDEVEKNLKKIHEELGLTFKAAIERIIGSNKPNTTDSETKAMNESDLNSNANELFGIVESSDDKTDSDYEKIEFPSSSKESDNTSQNIELKTENNKQIEEKKLVKINIDPPTPQTESFIDSDQARNPFVEPVNIDNSEVKLEPVSVDVSYHLKINNKDLDDGKSEINTVQKDIVVPKPRKRVKTFLTPINLVGASNIDPSSPIIISPVLIQPVILKPVTSPTNSQGQLFEIKPIEFVPRESTEPSEIVEIKSTVYYDDTDQVAPNANRNNKPVEIKPDDKAKRKGIYQKNTKTKPLPLLPWKSSSNESISDAQPSSPVRNSSPNPVDATNPTVQRLPKTQEWLIDNQYYQPMDNVPFVINTVQTFTKPKIVDNQIKEDIRFSNNTNPFLPPIPTRRRHSEHENVYEEIGEPTLPSIRNTNNIADDEKLSNIKNNKHSITEEFAVVTREELLKVPRKPKKPKKETQLTEEEIAKETAKITRSIISLSRTPSGNDTSKKTGNIGSMIHSLEKPDLEVPLRKLSLQPPKPPTLDTDTGSLPREKPYWRTLEHKRLSHPIRSLNTSSRPLRKWMAFVVRKLNVQCENVNNSYQCMEHNVCRVFLYSFGDGLR